MFKIVNTWLYKFTDELVLLLHSVITTSGFNPYMSNSPLLGQLMSCELYFEPAVCTYRVMKTH